jgi:UDP-N-acetyl-D-mannosaminuronate dehydrogenase
MPEHVIELVVDGFKNAKKQLADSTIAILGVSYKPNVKDIQLSPAEKIIEKLQQLNAKVKVYDPYYKSAEVFDIKTENDLPAAVSQADAVIIVTAHEEFQDLEPAFLASKMKKTPIIVDSRGIIDSRAAKKAGTIFRGLGRVNS